MFVFFPPELDNLAQTSTSACPEIHDGGAKKSHRKTQPVLNAVPWSATLLPFWGPPNTCLIGINSEVWAAKAEWWVASVCKCKCKYGASPGGAHKTDLILHSTKKAPK